MLAAMSNGESLAEGEIWCGAQPVPRDEKAVRVRALFDRVARRYNLLNDVLGAGVHRLWKAAMVDWLAPRPGMRLLDVAGGTGDIAILFLKTVGGNGSAVVCDINETMLRVGRDRALDKGVTEGIDWLCGNAEALPVEEGSIDAYTVGFGLRNVTDIEAALREARRVLRPGGRFLCLEFSRVRLPAFQRPYDIYSNHVLPRAARLASCGDEAEYLIESIRRFPDQETLSRAIADAGLGLVKYRNLFGGVAALHSAWRL